MMKNKKQHQRILIRNMYIVLFIILLGTLMNYSAIGLNGGKMPVHVPDRSSFLTDEQREEYFTFTNKEDVNVFYLTDFMKLKTEAWVQYFSIGDIFLVLSVLVAVFNAFYSFRLLYLEKKCLLK